MSQLCEKILESYQVRRTEPQKTAFIDLLQQHFTALRVENAGKNRNLVAGDIAKAKIIFTAHYDTPARSFWPNISMPYRPGLKFAYNMLVLMPIIGLMMLAMFGLEPVLPDIRTRALIGLAVYYVLYFYLFFGAPANQHNANDNTSGVCLLVRLLETLTPEQLEKVAFVFFDNEEKGCVGSKAFRKLHKAETENTLIFNFDCVADGEHILFLSSLPAEKQWEPLLRQVFRDEDGFTVGFTNSKKAKYSSDQKRFPMSIGTAALHHHPTIGYYFARIHTKKDTVHNKKNIEFLHAGLTRLIDYME